MDKQISYKEKELKNNIQDSYRRLSNIVNSLAMMSQQMDGKRSNLDSSYVKNYVMDDVHAILNNLRSFNVESSGLPNISLEDAIERIEKSMKRDIY